MMDNAAATAIGTPLAIGAIAIDPTNANNVIVGTGEGNNSVNKFSEAASTSPTPEPPARS